MGQMLTPNTCIEFTVSPLSPAWLKSLTTRDGAMPEYLNIAMAAGSRVLAFVVAADEEFVTLVFPGLHGGAGTGTDTIPKAAMEDFAVLPDVRATVEWRTRIVATPASMPGARLEVRHNGEPLSAQVELVDPQFVAMLGTAYAS